MSFLCEGHGLSRNDVHQRAALHAGEDSGVDLLRKLFIVRQDHAAAWTAQGLVRRRRHHMRVRDRRRMHAAGDEASEMRHVDEEICADFIGDFAERLEVDNARIGRTTRDDDFWLMSVRKRAHFVHIDAHVVLAHAVRHRLEPLAGHIELHAVAQMAAGCEIEAQKRVAGLHQRHEHGRIGRSAGVWLHVCELTSEKPRNPFNRKAFDNIDVLATAVIAPARIAFRILVGQDRTLRFQHRLADDVFGCDQLDIVALAAELFGNR